MNGSRDEAQKEFNPAFQAGYSYVREDAPAATVIAVQYERGEDKLIKEFTYEFVCFRAEIIAEGAKEDMFQVMYMDSQTVTKRAIMRIAERRGIETEYARHVTIDFAERADQFKITIQIRK